MPPRVHRIVRRTRVPSARFERRPRGVFDRICERPEHRWRLFGRRARRRRGRAASRRSFSIARSSASRPRTALPAGLARLRTKWRRACRTCSGVQHPMRPCSRQRDATSFASLTSSTHRRGGCLPASAARDAVGHFYLRLLHLVDAEFPASGSAEHPSFTRRDCGTSDDGNSHVHGRAHARYGGRFQRAPHRAPATFVNGPLADFLRNPGHFRQCFSARGARRDPARRPAHARELSRSGRERRVHRSRAAAATSSQRRSCVCPSRRSRRAPSRCLPPSGVTTREQYQEATGGDASCAGCHGLIQSSGLCLRALRRRRALARDRERPAHRRERRSSKTDAAGPFDGALELAHRLAASEDARRCFVAELVCPCPRPQPDERRRLFARNARSRFLAREPESPRAPRGADAERRVSLPPRGDPVSSPFRLSRRAVLRGAGSVAIALPWLEIMTLDRSSHAGSGAGEALSRRLPAGRHDPRELASDGHRNRFHAEPDPRAARAGEGSHRRARRHRHEERGGRAEPGRAWWHGSPAPRRSRRARATRRVRRSIR